MNDQTASTDPVSSALFIPANSTKICSRCKVPKPTTEFTKNKSREDGFNCQCKVCLKQNYLKNKDEILVKAKQHYLENKEEKKAYNKQYYSENKEEISLQHKQYISENKEEINLKYKEYYSDNKEEILFRNKKYQVKHKEEIRLWKNEYVRQKYNSDINYRMSRNLRRRVSLAIKNGAKSNTKTNVKSTSAARLLMCTVPFLRAHLESQFQPGMTWDNYGFGPDKWNIDHIIPCSSFVMSDPVEQYMCFRWQNLQPLWQPENSKKRAKMITNPTDYMHAFSGVI